MADSAPIIVTALFGYADFAYLDGLRRAHFPPERNRVPAHLTLFHHLPPSLDAELAQRLRAAVEAPPPPATLAGALDLGGGTALRVVSPALVALRADLAAAFAGLLTPQDAAGWRPHITIQNKVARDAARASQAELAGFAARPLAIAGLASWRYRGGPWEPIARYKFSRSDRSRRS